MAVPEVNKKLLSELEEMGFSQAAATRALHYSGNTNLEAAVSWFIDQENDPDIDEMPLVPVNIVIEDSEPSSLTDQVILKAQEMRARARIRKKDEQTKFEGEREKKRIRLGKELQEAKQIAEENERKRFLAFKKAEKEEDKRARHKIIQKLQQDKDPLHVGSATAPEKHGTKVELMRDCLRFLRHNHKEDDAKVRKAFDTLLIYIRNVVRNPNDEKFRKIRTSNPLFQDRIGAFQEGIKFLELCGFEIVEGGKFLYLPKDKIDMAVLRSAGTELHSALTNPYFGLLSKTI